MKYKGVLIGWMLFSSIAAVFVAYLLWTDAPTNAPTPSAAPFPTEDAVKWRWEYRDVKIEMEASDDCSWRFYVTHPFPDYSLAFGSGKDFDTAFDLAIMIADRMGQ